MLGSDERIVLGLEFGILGPLRITRDGEELPIAGEKLRGLLAILLLEAGHPVSVERLVDELWEDAPPATARQSLYVHVARLRRSLAADGSDDSPLTTSPHGYMLQPEQDRVDATRFRRLVADAREARRAGHVEGAADGYRAALSLWRGAALEDVPLRSLDAARSELEELRLAALEERIDADLSLGRAHELVAELEELVTRHPLREGFRAQLMTALYATGRQADALEAYQGARRDLDELGLVPGPQLRDLEQAILRQDERLVTGAPPAAGAPSPAPRPRTARRWQAGVALVIAGALIAGGIAFLVRDKSSSAVPSAPASERASLQVRPDSLVEIDPATNRVVSVARVGKDPDGIAFTRDAAWVVTRDRTVDRVDLGTRQVRAIGGIPVARAVAGTLADDVWVSSFEAPWVTLVARHGRLVGDDDVAVAAAPPRVRLPGSAEALTVGGGFLWVTSPQDSGGRNTVSRIDLRTRRLVSTVRVGRLPLYAAFGYGSLWVSNYKGNSVSVVRPGSERPETVTLPDSPLGIAAGAGGIWVVTFWNAELVRIDPETRRIRARIPIGRGPLDVAVGGGAVWTTDRDSQTITKVDPATDKVVATIQLPVAPWGIRFARGRLWVTTQRCGSPVTPCG